MAWREWSWQQARGGTLPVLALQYSLQCGATPWSATSPGLINFTGPARVQWRVPTQSLASPRQLLLENWPLQGVVAQTTFALMFFIMLPLAFLVLPISMRRAKVRWAHVGRIAAYSIGVPALLVIASLIVFTVYGLHWPNLFLLAAPIWLLGWWWRAIRRYLVMEHSWAIWLSITAIALLVAATATFHLFESQAWRWLMF